MEDNPIFIFIAIIAGLFLVWLVGGGPARYAEQQEKGKFIKPAAPLDSGEVYDEKVFDSEHFWGVFKKSETE